MKPQAPEKSSDEYLHNCEVRLFICLAALVLSLLLVAMWLVGLYKPPHFQLAVAVWTPWLLERWLSRRWPT